MVQCCSHPASADVRGGEWDEFAVGEHGVGEAFEQVGVVVFAELFGDGVLDFVAGDRGVSFRQPVRNHRGELVDRNLFDPITRTAAGGRADRDRAVRSQHCRRVVSVVRW